MVEVKHNGLTMMFEKDGTVVRFDHIKDDKVISSSTGESAIQELIKYAIYLSKSSEDLETCMQSIRSFYAHYLIDKSALNTLAWKIKNIDIVSAGAGQEKE